VTTPPMSHTLPHSSLVYEAKQNTLISPRGLRSALVIVDVQNDFLPGGAVPHYKAEEIIPLINRIRNAFRFDLVVVTQDWHPEQHVSFASTHLPYKNVEVFQTITVDSSAGPVKQKLWPVHCVRDTPGAELAKTLQVYPSDVIIQKGSMVAEDSPSVFYETHSIETKLGQLLVTNNIADVYFCGIGLDHAIYKSAMDCAKLKNKNKSLSNLSTFIIKDACSTLRNTASDPAGSVILEAQGHSLEREGVQILSGSVMLSQNEDKRRDTAKYLSKHNIIPIFEELCAALVYEKPENPREFLIQALEKLQAPGGSLSSLSVFKDEDIETYFNMVDVSRRGVLDATQARNALARMGAAVGSLQISPDDTFTRAEFKVLAKRAIDRRVNME